jgi:hypothetical protein
VLRAPVRPAIFVMELITKVNVLPMGRPPGLVQDRLLQMRVSDEFIAVVDAWRAKQPDVPNRSEAIRRLVELGLGVKRKGAK